jgi:hypothetical protein
MAPNQSGQPDVAEVIAWALDIAASAPAKQAKYVSDAKVPWRKIEGLRKALDGIGADWRAVKAARDAR